MMQQKIFTFWQTYLFTPVSSQGFHLMRRLWALAVFIKMLPYLPDLFVKFAAPQNWSQIVYIHPYRTTLFLLSDHPVFVALIYGLLMVSCISLFFGRYAKIAMPIALLGFISFFERNLLPFHSETSMLSSFGFFTLLFTYFEDDRHFTMPVFLWRLLVWQVVVMYGTSIWYKFMSPGWLSGNAVAFALTYETYFPSIFVPLAVAIPTPLKILTYIVLAWETAWFLILIPASFWRSIRFPMMTTTIRRFLIIIGIIMHGAWALLLRDVYPLSLSAFAAYAGLLEPEDFKVLLRFLKKR